LIARRRLLQSALGFIGGTFGVSGYALGVEPLLRLVVSRYRLTPAGWPSGLQLRICALADFHAVNPGMSVERINYIARSTNALQPDLILLLGDYSHGITHGWPIPAAEWAKALSVLKAPLGVHAILGNHDWWDDKEAQAAGHGPVEARRVLEANAIPVYENSVIRLIKDGQPFWIAGLADQLALFNRRRTGHWRTTSLADLEGTLAKVTDTAPIILLAHEPNIFPTVPSRVSLTLSGHTHGGQVRFFGYSPVVYSRYGNRYAYGHVRENGRDLIVSGGLGCSEFPVRFGVPPEIVLVEMGGPSTMGPSLFVPYAILLRQDYSMARTAEMNLPRQNILKSRRTHL
jgi:uncharacterized protein